jgi:hypothetical protein
MLKDNADTMSALDLFIESPDVVRGIHLLEGLLVQVEPQATRTVAQLVQRKDEVSETFDRTYSLQTSAVPWDWNSMPLVDEPVEVGAEIAVRDDGRAVLLNLEAMSVHHDYDGIGGRHLLIACIPRVSAMAHLASDCSSVAATLEEFTSERTASYDALAQLEMARRRIEAAQKRQLLWTYGQLFTHTEKFATWTHGGQLATILAEHWGVRSQVMADQMERMGTNIGHSIEAKIQRTAMELQEEEKERQQRRLGKVLVESVALGVGALSLLVSLFMTTAAAPAWGSQGTVGMGFWSLGIVGLTAGLGTVLGYFIRKFR